MRKLFSKSIYLILVIISITFFLINEKNINATNNEFSKYYEHLYQGDWSKPGLYQKDGTSHTRPLEFVSTGNVVNVMNHGAKSNDTSFDNTDAFKEAIDTSKSGDTIYVPNGTYYFEKASLNNNNYIAHINLNKNNIVFKGESKESTVLVSNFNEDLNSQSSGGQTTVICVLNYSNIVITDLTVSSSETRLPDENSSNTNTNFYKAPKNGIAIDRNNDSGKTSNIMVKNVIVERYRRMGVRISRSNNVTVKDSLFRYAVDLGGSGHGYGVVIQGKDASTDYVDKNQDPVFNVVENNTFLGPYIRHGVLIQYLAHNNLVTKNIFDGTLLDSIDLHGELEFSNEICENTITNCRAGAGIGVGNTGASHAASGKNNLLYKNVIENSLRGIDVMQGSQQTIILENEIRNLTATNSIGISLKNAPSTFMLGNKISNINNGSNSYGIRIDYVSPSSNSSAEEYKNNLPRDLVIVGNVFNQLRRGIYLAVKAKNLTMVNNTFENISSYDFLDNTENFSYKDILDYPDITLESQFAKNGEAIRFIGTIFGFTLEDLDDMSIKFVLTLDGQEEEVEISCVYKSVVNTKYECYESFYVVFTINGLSTSDLASQYNLTAKLIVSLNSEIHESNIIISTIKASPR